MSQLSSATIVHYAGVVAGSCVEGAGATADMVKQRERRRAAAGQYGEDSAIAKSTTRYLFYRTTLPAS